MTHDTKSFRRNRGEAFVQHDNPELYRTKSFDCLGGPFYTIPGFFEHCDKNVFKKLGLPNTMLNFINVRQLIIGVISQTDVFDVCLF